MVYKRLSKKPKKSKNKNKNSCIVECKCQSCSLDPNGYKKVSKATRTRHRAKDREQSEQQINKNPDQNNSDFDRNFNQEPRFIIENFNQEINTDDIIGSDCTSESDTSSIKSDSTASLNITGMEIYLIICFKPY